MEEIVRREGIDCGFSRVDGYLVADSEAAVEEIEREAQAARRAGIAAEPTSFTPGLLQGPGPCLRFPRQAQFHPLRFLAGLARVVDRMGGRIYTDTHVESVTPGTPVRVETSRGPVVTANAALVATDIPIGSALAMHLKQAAYRTYVIAAPVPAASVRTALCWDTAKPYHYVRIQAIVEAQRAREMLLVGGEDHKTGQADDTLACYERLESWMREHFPMAGEADYQWSGQIVEPYDGLAFIGHSPAGANVFIGTGTSGNGMTYGMITAMILRDLVAGRDNPWAKVFDPSRLTLRAAPQFLRENVNVAAKYAEVIGPGEVASEDVVPRNGARSCAADCRRWQSIATMPAGCTVTPPCAPISGASSTGIPPSNRGTVPAMARATVASAR